MGIGIVVLGIAVVWLNRIVKNYFPSMRKFHTAGGNALVRLEAVSLPGYWEHVVEAVERDDEEQDDQGDPPQAGKGEDLRGSH